MKRAIALSVMVVSLIAGHSAHGDTNFVFYPESAAGYTLLDGESIYYALENCGWGPGWAWFPFRGASVVSNQHRYFSSRANISRTPYPIHLRHESWQSASNQVVLRYELSAPTSSPLTTVSAVLTPRKPAFANGMVLAITPSGETNSRPLPFSGICTLGDPAARMILRTAEGHSTIFDPGFTWTRACRN
jgi:hypothetical protein